ncbi:hypothetical protein AD428_09435 [Achromobacter sp. DMS1]|nr:hypothetical protein AD428_09435 [Achromobacter sp. DMS1]
MQNPGLDGRFALRAPRARGIRAWKRARAPWERRPGGGGVAADLGRDFGGRLGRGYAERQHAAVERLADARRGDEFAVDHEREHVAHVLGAHFGQLARAGFGKAQTHEVLALAVDQGRRFGEVGARQYGLLLHVQLAVGQADFDQARRRLRLRDIELHRGSSGRRARRGLLLARLLRGVGAGALSRGGLATRKRQSHDHEGGRQFA